MDFNSMADAELLFRDMVCGDVHLAHEVSHVNYPTLSATQTEYYRFMIGHCWCDRSALQRLETVLCKTIPRIK